MNCHDFDSYAVDLASDHLVDATRRAEALNHATSCARCALRLSDERALTGGLRSLAKAANEEAPPQVAAALLMAFREQHAAPAIVPPVSTFRKKWYYTAASVAAIALIVALFALLATRNRSEQPPAPQKAINQGPVGPEQTPPPSVPQPQSSTSEKQLAPVPPSEYQRRTAQRSKDNNRSKRPSDFLNTNTEIATDFIPLANRETLGEMDGGQVMRVELPRSALMSFGLPMDMERASERIKADVVVGNDGLARAIRFVR